LFKTQFNRTDFSPLKTRDELDELATPIYLLSDVCISAENFAS